MNFDHVVLDVAISGIENLSVKLRQHHHLDNPHLSAENTLKNLKNIREHDSLRIHYKTIFNQSLVLLVSHFSSALSDVFESSLNFGLVNKKLGHLKKEEVKLTFGELQKIIEADRKDILAEVFTAKKEISFQDMQSVFRAFRNYLGLEIDRDENVNNIILSQACRHSIVHDGAIVNSRTMKQIEDATPRTLKEGMTLGTEINFSPSEIMIAEKSMTEYLKKVCLGLTEGSLGS
jgi:hypothetical protein